jgi:hypothetical protein
MESETLPDNPFYPVAAHGALVYLPGNRHSEARVTIPVEMILVAPGKDLETGIGRNERVRKYPFKFSGFCEFVLAVKRRLSWQPGFPVTRHRTVHLLMRLR